MRGAFLESYGGQTTDQLIELDQRYRTDSIVLAFEQAIQQAAEKRALSREETYVLAVEGLEREVNNGGYSQFFFNSSNEFAGDIVAALSAIKGELTREAMEAAIQSEDAALKQRLAACDERYFSNDEPIADRLFDWIKRNRAQIRIG